MKLSRINKCRIALWNTEKFMLLILVDDTIHYSISDKFIGSVDSKKFISGLKNTKDLSEKVVPNYLSKGKWRLKLTFYPSRLGNISKDLAK